MQKFYSCTYVVVQLLLQSCYYCRCTNWTDVFNSFEKCLMLFWCWFLRFTPLHSCNQIYIILLFHNVSLSLSHAFQLPSLEPPVTRHGVASNIFILALSPCSFLNILSLYCTVTVNLRRFVLILLVVLRRVERGIDHKITKFTPATDFIVTCKQLN